MAGTVASNTSNFIPVALNDLIGTKIKVIKGYRGSPDQALAMMRGETDAIGGMAWEAIRTNHPDWLTEKKIKVFYAQGAHRIAELPDAPGLLDLAVDEKSRQILGLLGSGPDIGRTIVTEPGIPPERAAALRQAFQETMQDPEFVADIKQRNLTIEPLEGKEVQTMVEAVVPSTPKELVWIRRGNISINRTSTSPKISRCTTAGFWHQTLTLLIAVSEIRNNCHDASLGIAHLRCSRDVRRPNGSIRAEP